MSKWTLFALTALFSLTIFGSFGCSNKKYEEAKGLVQNSNQLRTDLTNNPPQATWTDPQLTEYERKIDQYKTSIGRLNSINGDGVQVYGTEDADRFVTWATGRLQSARREKAKFGPVNNSDNSEVVRYNQLEAENDRIYKGFPRPEKGKGMDTLALSDMKKLDTGVEKILSNLKEQQNIAARNSVIPQEKKSGLAQELSGFTTLGDAVKKVMAQKISSKTAKRAQ